MKMDGGVEGRGAGRGVVQILQATDSSVWTGSLSN